MAAGVRAEAITDARDGGGVGEAPAALLDPQHTAAIAARWYAALATTGFIPWGADDVAGQVRTWTGQLADLLLAESGDPGPARAIGAALAQLHYLRPAALEGTLTVLGEELAVGLPAARQARLAALLGALAAGFSEQARRTILGEQEALRRALVAERDALATALHRSEARYHAIFAQAALGIALFDADGRLLEANPALAGMLGYSAEELQARPFTALTHRDDLPATRRLYQELVTGPRDQAQMEKRYLRRDGSLLWAHLTVSLVRDAAGVPLFAAALIKDITAAKQAEAERVALYDRLLHLQEEEQRRLAEDLHDGVLQTVLDVVREGKAVGELFAAPAAGNRAEQHLHRLLARGRDAEHELRALCLDLYPLELADLGLVPALEELAGRITRDGPVPVACVVPAFPTDYRLPRRLEDTLYRVAREAVSNACRHAAATRIQLELALGEGEVCLTVRDDGQGFVPARTPCAWLRQGHLGLVSMRERVERAGGTFAVESAPGAGTTVRVRLPVGPDHGTTDATGAPR